MKATIRLYLLLIVLPCIAYSQKQNAPPDSTVKLSLLPNDMQQINPLPFQHFGSDQGLSSGINSIFEDKKGFLWISSIEGIFRYDGLEFKSFHKVANQSAGLANSWLYKIFGDKDGGMWVLSKGDILHAYDDVEEQFHQVNLIPDPTIDSSKVEVLFLLGDQKKRLWIATKNHGLNLLDKASGQLTKVDLGGGKEKGKLMLVNSLLLIP